MAGRQVDEKRAEPRHDIELPVMVNDSGNRVEARINFDLLDLSLGGAFVRSFLLFEVGEELQLEFQIPGGPLVRARGRVVRLARQPDQSELGMGVAFSHLSEPDREAVRAYLAAR